MSVEVTRLPAGLVVITDGMPHLQTASLGVWVGCGSRYEAADEHGISHFLEHMAFKGTARRTARQIAEEIEAVGGDLNAGTGVEMTAYYARVLKTDIGLGLDVLSDILSHPSFDPDEINREKNVIVQEIGAVEDTPDDLVFEHLQATAFAGQPVGRSILGTPATVRSIDAKRLRGYLTRNYRAPAMVVAAAGAVDHEAMIAEAEHRFSKFVGPAAAAPPTARLSRSAISNRSISPWGWRACRSAIPRSSACRSSPTCSAAECRHACSRRCGSSAGCAIRSMRSTRPMPIPGCSASMPAPTPSTRRS
jgi:predicted Zn-dependent peptidase